SGGHGRRRPCSCPPGHRPEGSRSALRGWFRQGGHLGSAASERSRPRPQPFRRLLPVGGSRCVVVTAGTGRLRSIIIAGLHAPWPVLQSYFLAGDSERDMYNPAEGPSRILASDRTSEDQC